MRATSTKISSPGSLQGYAHVFNARHTLSQHRFWSYELGFGPLSVFYLYGSLWSWRICFGDCWLSFLLQKHKNTFPLSAPASTCITSVDGSGCSASTLM